MDMGRKMRSATWALALVLTLYNVQPAAALTLGASRPQPGETAGERVYEVRLDTAIVAAGEKLSYLTVDSSFSGNPLAEEYYPGGVTIELAGTVTVAAGGQLVIGKMAVGGPEPSPVLRGELPPEGLIRVEAGGALWLNGVTPELSGDGLAIVQEPGAVVELYDTPIEEELCQWGGAVADNRYAAPMELPLLQGEELTAGHLPQEGKVWRNERGKSEFIRLPMEWDISGCAGQTQGQATVSGTYIDRDGQPLPALLPVEATVRWYTPEDIILTEKAWLGSTAALARLGYLPLPEEAAELWGELSRDGGKSWERWEKCDFEESDGRLTCTFTLSDAVPRLYRLMAADEAGDRFWRSEAVELPEEDSDDQGGNRGGSTDPIPPSREPEPVEEKKDDPAAAPLPSPTPFVEPTPVLAVGPEETPWPPAQPSPESIPIPTPVEIAVQEVTLPPPPLAPEPAESVLPEPEETASPVRLLPVEAASQPPAAAVPAAVQESGAPEAPIPTPEAPPVPAPSERAATPDPTAEPKPLAVPQRLEKAPPQAPKTLSPALQMALAAAGLALCAAIGVAVARRGMGRKKK